MQRRTFLSGLTVVGTVTIAGCGGSPEFGEDETNQDSKESQESKNAGTSNNTTMAKSENESSDNTTLYPNPAGPNISAKD
jgi:hypothetical protein